MTLTPIPCVPGYAGFRGLKFSEWHAAENYILHGGHKPGKHGKPGKLREFEKLSKSQGNLNFCRKKPGKLRENEKYVT